MQRPKIQRPENGRQLDLARPFGDAVVVGPIAPDISDAMRSDAHARLMVPKRLCPGPAGDIRARQRNQSGQQGQSAMPRTPSYGCVPKPLSGWRAEVSTRLPGGWIACRSQLEVTHLRGHGLTRTIQPTFEVGFGREISMRRAKLRVGLEEIA
jgi:hypothetical protein